MKILVVHQHYVVGRYQNTLAEIVRNNNAEIHFLVPPSFKMGIEIQAVNMYPREIIMHVLPAPFSAKGKQHLFFFIGLSKLIRRLKPDVVWSQAPNSVNTYQVTRICRRLKIPTVLLRFSNYKRDYWKMHHPLDPRRYLFHFLRRWNYAYASATYVIDDLVESVVLWEGFNKKIFKGMTMGISDEFFNMGRKRLTEGKFDTLRVVFVGRFTPAKGLKILIDAFDAAAQNNEMTLTIAGSGDYEREVREHVAAKKNSERIVISGFVPYEKMPQYLSEFDVCVLCSEAKGKALEQFGRVLVEAQAAGCIVIGSDVGGIPNAIRTGGFVIPEGSVAHLEDKLRYLAGCDNQTFNSLRHAGFLSALENFSDPVLGQEIFKNLSSINYR